MRVANEILVADGHNPDRVAIALLLVESIAKAKAKMPRAVAYYVRSVENTFQDPDESKLCDKIAAERKRSGVAIDAPLRPEEWHPAAKITFVHSCVEEAVRDGRRAVDVAVERLASDKPFGAQSP